MIWNWDDDRQACEVCGGNLYFTLHGLVCEDCIDRELEAEAFDDQPTENEELQP